MKKVRRLLLFYFIYSKRPLKKVSFWLFMCAVPLLALGMRNLSAGDSGMLHILLCMEDPQDDLAGQVVDRLLSKQSVIHYTLIQQPEEACAIVSAGKADAAWIFPKDLQEQLDRFVSGGHWEEGVVRVVEREDNVALRLAREKLFGALYPHVSYSLYRDFILKDVGPETEEEKLLSCYEEMAVEGNLFRLGYEDRENEDPETGRRNFLVAPLRGMLSLLVLLCVLTATMYFLQDQEKGALDAIPLHRRTAYLYLYQITVTGAIAVAALSALRFSGVLTKWGREAVWMAVYIAMCMGFCSILRRLLGNFRRLAAVAPVILLASLVLCPVIFTMGELNIFQYLLPPFYYLNGIYNDRYFCGVVLYCLAVFGIDYAWDRNIFLSCS